MKVFVIYDPRLEDVHGVCSTEEKAIEACKLVGTKGVGFFAYELDEIEFEVNGYGSRVVKRKL